MKLDSISFCIELCDKNTMPIFGLGCWDMRGDSVYNAVSKAIKEGYRLFDTAQFYGNEADVGRALNDSGLSRDEYFVVTKLDFSVHGYKVAKSKLKESLSKLGLDYVDLYLIHSPRVGKIIETWKAFVELKAEGLTKSIGVSNFNIHHLEPLLKTGMEIPNVNQIELHPWNQHRSIVDYCNENKIAIMGYCPLARGKMFEDGKCIELDNLSKIYDKTKAQIILRWAIQSGYITIPKSGNETRIRENADLFTWSLRDEDMLLVNNFNQDRSISSADAVTLCDWID